MHPDSHAHQGGKDNKYTGWLRSSNLEVLETFAVMKHGI